MEKTKIRVEWVNRNYCCGCGSICFTHSGSDGHRYCDSCAQYLVDSGVAEWGGGHTTKDHRGNEVHLPLFSVSDS